MGTRKKVMYDNEGLIPMEVSGRSEIKVRSDCHSRESFVESKLNREIERSVRTDESLQEQIDRLMSSNFAVRDVVFYHDDLVGYPTENLLENDVIVVLYDTEARDRSTYYRWDGSQFVSIGSSSYTIDEVDRLVGDLNAQISYLGNRGSVRDVVANHASLLDYDVSTFVEGDVIGVLDDEEMAHAATYYVLDANREWVAHGSLGPNYYTKAQLDDRFAQIDATLEDHEVRITDNRDDIDNRVSEEEAYDILVG